MPVSCSDSSFLIIALVQRIINAESQHQAPPHTGECSPPVSRDAAHSTFSQRILHSVDVRSYVERLRWLGPQVGLEAARRRQWEDVDSRGARGRTLRSWAVGDVYPRMAPLLLASGADAALPEDCGRMPVLWAARGRDKCIKQKQQVQEKMVVAP